MFKDRIGLLFISNLSCLGAFTHAISVTRTERGAWNAATLQLHRTVEQGVLDVHTIQSSLFLVWLISVCLIIFFHKIFLISDYQEYITHGKRRPTPNLAKLRPNCWGHTTAGPLKNYPSVSYICVHNPFLRFYVYIWTQFAVFRICSIFETRANSNIQTKKNFAFISVYGQIIPFFDTNYSTSSS